MTGIADGYVLLLPARDASRDRWVAQTPGVTSITTDLRTGLLLVGTGACAGLWVYDYGVLAPLIRELHPAPGGRRPIVLYPDQQQQPRRPEIRDPWRRTSRRRPYWTEETT